MPQTGSEMLHVEVAYARADRQFLYALELPAGSTLLAAIMASGVLAQCPEIDLAAQHVGVFGVLRNVQDAVSEGDRVEIYRPLTADPKAARRARVISARRQRRS